MGRGEKEKGGKRITKREGWEEMERKRRVGRGGEKEKVGIEGEKEMSAKVTSRKISVERGEEENSGKRM